MLAGNIAGKTRTLPLAIYCCNKWGLALSQSICCNYVITLPDYFIFTEFLVSALGEDRNEINC